MVYDANIHGGIKTMQLRNRKKWIIAFAIGSLLASIPMQAAGYKKTKSVNYHPVNFYYNGGIKYLSTTPISIDGVTYLPARTFCDAIGMEITWDQSGGNLYVNNGNSYNSVLSLQTELRAKEYEIASLKQELAKYKVSTTTSSGSSSHSINFDTTSGTDILGTELTETEEELERLYEDYFKDIEFDFRVRVSGNRLVVKISYDTSSENKEFNNLSTREVKEFVKEVCETVRERHDNIIIDGMIVYSGSNTNKYEFSYSKNDTLTYGSNYNSDESSIISIVKKVGRIDIRDYSSSISMSKVEASISDTREEVTFRIYIDTTSDIKQAWNNNVGEDRDTTLRTSLRGISKDIEYDIDYDIFGEIYDASTSKLIAEYDYSYDEITTYKID